MYIFALFHEKALKSYIQTWTNVVMDEIRLFIVIATIIPAVCWKQHLSFLIRFRRLMGGLMSCQYRFIFHRLLVENIYLNKIITNIESGNLFSLTCIDLTWGLLMFNNLSLSTDRITKYCVLFAIIRVQFYSVGVSQILY